MPVDTSVSDAAVEKATGRTWHAWFTRLDAWGAKGKTHKEIATHLMEDEGVSGWWAQTVSVHYERDRGLRAVGERSKGFGVSAQKTLPLDAAAAWARVTDPALATAWLGGNDPVTLKEGRSFTLPDGTRVSVRALRPLALLRLGWQEAGWEKPSTLEVQVERKGDRAIVRYSHEALPDDAAREAYRARWKSALAVIATAP